MIEHIDLLAGSEAPLPPILVHRGSMRVIDGMHRLRAAMLRGDETVEVLFFDGDEDEAFVAAVRANVTHGLPLSRSDREAAAVRLLAMYPERSDRWIAGIAGLSPGAVAGARKRAVVDPPTEAPRVGRDGKLRPLNSTRAREIASDVIAQRPDAPLREVARIAGLSPATVRDVRERMRRGEDPVPARQRDTRRGWRTATAEHATAGRQVTRCGESRDVDTLLQILHRDPTLRFSETGRSMLRWLAANARGVRAWPKLIEAAPPHGARLVAELARAYAEEWSTFADKLDQRLNPAR